MSFNVGPFGTREVQIREGLKISNMVELAVDPIVLLPIIDSIDPPSVFANQTFFLTVNGQNFGPNAEIIWDGTAVSTIVVTNTILQATLTTPLVPAGVSNISVQVRQNGNLSNTIFLTVLTGDSIWDPAITSTLLSAGTYRNMGNTFYSNRNGNIIGVRYYKYDDATNPGPHIGFITNWYYQVLGQVTYSGETPSGWQTQLFASPIPITAGALPGTLFQTTLFAPKNELRMAYRPSALKGSPIIFYSGSYVNNTTYPYLGTSLLNIQYAIDVIFQRN